MNTVDNLYTEYNEVRTKLSTLINFCDSKKFEELSIHHQKLLLTQQTVMASYVNVLDARIKAIEAGV